MDKELNVLLDDVKARIKLGEFENPVTSREVALDVATRAGLLFRFAQNGVIFTLRWTQNEPAQEVHQNQLCLTICKRIVDTLPLLDGEALILDDPAPT
ncbi:MAG: hypothetical protein V3V85_01810, partial [Candidatus Thorarchaeota archaeon]